MKVKIPSFVVKYANYKIDNLLSSGMEEKIRNERIKTIDKAVFLVEHGFITIDESMKIILET